MDTKIIANHLLDLLGNCENTTKDQRDAVYLTVDLLRTVSSGVVIFDGKLYTAARPKLKTQHMKSGEHSFAGFYEVRR